MIQIQFSSSSHYNIRKVLNRTLQLLVILLLVPVWLLQARDVQEVSQPIPDVEMEVGQKEGWLQVQSEQKPWTRWWWMGNAVTRDGITYHLEKFAEANIGGVEISPIYGVEGYEEETVEYLSEEWMDLLQYTVEEAGRLGLKVDIITGSGWPFGGNHVTDEDAARRLVTQTYRLQAGEQLQNPLVHVNRPTGASAPLHSLTAYSETGDILDLTDRVDGEGRLSWIPEEGSWYLVALFNSWTNMRVKRPAPGEEGYVVDHFSERALDHYLARFDDAFRDRPEGMLRGFFNDSFEVYDANWTGDFLEEFKNWQGYDLREVLPAFLGEPIPAGPGSGSGLSDQEITQRVRADFHETIHFLTLERFLQHWKGWANEMGALARNQAHGSPANLLDVYGAADIPETEIFGQTRFEIPGLRQNGDLLDREDSPNPLVLKFASSGSHVEGRGLASSESATWLDEHFTVSLSQVRPHLDMQFISGINHIFYHGTPYSPEEEMWPGWKFYASTHFAPTNTFWNDFGELNRYIANTQAVLQAGMPYQDILLYFPIHDLWHSFDGDPGDPFYLRVHNPDQWLHNTSFGDIAADLWDRGYSFDYISDRQLQGVSGDGGVLHTGGASYKTIIVPEITHMPVRTFQKLMELAETGATVIFKGNLPETVPGYHELEERERKLADLRGQLEFQPGENQELYEAAAGTGRFVKGDSSRYLLNSAGVERESVVDLGVDFIRRTHPDGLYYFLVNLHGEPVDEWVTLGTPAESALLMDPMSERQGDARLRTDSRGDTEIYLQLEPGESRIIKTCFSGCQPVGEWEYLRPAGDPFEITGEWDVRFLEGGSRIPDPFRTEELVSWSELEDPEAQTFSGSASYRIAFEHPGEEADAWRLDLGRVAESARVYLNGRELAAVWSHPFVLDIEAGLVLQGENILEIEVTNLMLNRIIEMDRQGIRWQKFHDINMVNIDYRPFNSADWPLMESGLIGPVRLIPMNGL